MQKRGKTAVIVLLSALIVLSVGITAACAFLWSHPALRDELFPAKRLQTSSRVSSDQSDSGNLPLSESDEEYLSQCAFVGDSRTHAMDLYGYADISQTIAEDGLNHKTALTKSFADIGDGYLYTMQQALRIVAPKRVYVGFGINGISFMSEEEFISCYQELIGQIEEACPDAEIVVESIIPVTESYSVSHPEMGNSVIERYNALLRQLAVEEDVHYIDLGDALKTPDGALDSGYSAGDGLHLNATAYKVIFQVILAERIDRK